MRPTKGKALLADDNLSDASGLASVTELANRLIAELRGMYQAACDAIQDRENKHKESIQILAQLALENRIGDADQELERRGLLTQSSQSESRLDADREQHIRIYGRRLLEGKPLTQKPSGPAEPKWKIPIDAFPVLQAAYVSVIRRFIEELYQLRPGEVLVEIGPAESIPSNTAILEYAQLTLNVRDPYSHAMYMVPLVLNSIPAAVEHIERLMKGLQVLKAADPVVKGERPAGIVVELEHEEVKGLIATRRKQKNARVSYPIGNTPLQKLRITVVGDDKLKFTIDGKGKTFMCSELGGWLYNSKSKLPSVNFEILKKLARDYDDTHYMPTDSFSPTEIHTISVQFDRVEDTLQQVLGTDKKLFQRATAPMEELRGRQEKPASVELADEISGEAIRESSSRRRIKLVGIRPIFGLFYMD